LKERKNTVAGAMTTVAAVVTTKENVLPLNGTTDAANDGDLVRTSMYRKKFLFVVIFVFLLLLFPFLLPLFPVLRLQEWLDIVLGGGNVDYFNL